MGYYIKHIFICTNTRDGQRACCANHSSEDIKAYMKQKLKNLKISGAGKFRVNSAGCMGRCSEGPVLTVYPDGTWYSYKTIKDIDEIIESHLVHGLVVKRLLLSEFNKES